jgi:hypothetical protein
MKTEEEEQEENYYYKIRDVVTKFLNLIEKNYEVKLWDSGEGVDIIIKESEVGKDYKIKPYTQTISITAGGYVCFEKQENVDGK